MMMMMTRAATRNELANPINYLQSTLVCSSSDLEANFGCPKQVQKHTLLQDVFGGNRNWFFITLHLVLWAKKRFGKIEWQCLLIINFKPNFLQIREYWIMANGRSIFGELIKICMISSCNLVCNIRSVPREPYVVFHSLWTASFASEK